MHSDREQWAGEGNYVMNSRLTDFFTIKKRLNFEGIMDVVYELIEEVLGRIWVDMAFRFSPH